MSLYSGWNEPRPESKNFKEKRKIGLRKSRMFGYNNRRKKDMVQMKRFVVRIRLPYDDSDDPEDYTVTTFAETQERARRILVRTELC